MPTLLASSEQIISAIVGIVFLLIILSPIWLLLGGGVIGRILEKRHFADIERRERENADIILSDLKTPPPGLSYNSSQIVTGSTVVAADYFKAFAASLKTLIGGRMNSLQRMQDRARREAILRMVAEARALGARGITNVRIETSTISGKRRGKCAGVEVLASGTALLG